MLNRLTGLASQASRPSYRGSTLVLSGHLPRDVIPFMPVFVVGRKKGIQSSTTAKVSTVTHSDGWSAESGRDYAALVSIQCQFQPHRRNHLACSRSACVTVKLVVSPRRRRPLVKWISGISAVPVFHYADLQSIDWLPAPLKTGSRSWLRCDVPSLRV